MTIMNKKYAFIWDLDGTLFDSYDEIVSSVFLTLEHFGIEEDEAEARRYMVLYSVKKYFMKIESETGIPYAELDSLFEKYHHSRYLEVTAMPHATEILQYLQDHGNPNFVFTHRTSSTLPILRNLNMLSYFTEVVTIGEGFARKPDPQAVRYLLEKYSLDPEYTWYVGDRKIDMECGRNAGIKTILYLPAGNSAEPSGLEDLIIMDLMDIVHVNSI